MAKKKKQPKSLSDAQAYEAYLADQDKKKQEQANGQVRFREASNASRIQYTNPTYKGNSSNANYKWETQALRDYKMPKGMGKSYNDKFDYMTRQMGMTPGQAEDFRTYMDFSEDKSKDKYAVKRNNFKKDENGNLVEINSDTPDEAWKLDRSTYTDGSGLHTKAEIIDGILSGMTSKSVQALRNSQERQAKEVENQKKEEEKKALQRTIAETNKTAGIQTSASANMPHNNVQTDQKKGKNSFLDGVMKALEIVDRPGDAVRTGIKEKMDGNSFWQGAKEGFMGDKNTSGTELNKALGFDPKKDKVDRTLANVLGMVGTGAVGTVVQSLNKDLANKMGDLASGMATEVALDPLNLVGGGAVKGAKSLSLPRQLEEVLKATGSTKYTDDAFKAALHEAYAPKGDVSKLIPETPKPAQMTPQQVLDEMKQGWKNPNLTLQPKTMDGFKTNEIPQVETPNVLDDFFNFAQSGQGPKARTGFEQGNMPRYAKENLSKQADEILNRVDQVNNKPKGHYEQRILDIQKAMNENKNLTPEQHIAYKQAQDVWDMRQASEDAFVEQELAPFHEVSQQQAEAQTYYRDIKKKADEEIKRIQGIYGRIKIPRGAKEDYPIPHRFKAAEDNMLYDDIHSFTDQEGFSSADEAIQYLRQLDESANAKLKDLMPEDSHIYKEHEWKALEDAARERYRSTEEGQALDKLVADSLDSFNTKDFDALYTANKNADDPATFEELVKLAQMQGNAKAIDPTIKDILRRDPKIKEAIQKLNKSGTKKPSLKADTPNTSALDEMLNFLEGKGPTKRTIDNAPTPGIRQTPEEILGQAKNQEIVNNSQVVEQANTPKKMSIDELNALVYGKQPTPKPQTGDVLQPPSQESLLKLNAQRFNDGDAPTNSMYSYSKNEPDLVSDHMNLWQKGRESLVNSLQKFQVVSDNIIKRNATKIKANYESRIEAAKQTGRTEEAKRLAKEFKYLHKDESELLKAAQNEQTSYMLTDELIQSTYGQAARGVEKAGHSIADAWEYQAAKNLYYQMTKGGHTDYQLPKGWDIGRLADVINKGDQVEEFKQFSAAINDIRETRLQYLRDYGLKSTEEFADLAKNPHYIPMMKDFDWTKNSLEASLKKQSSVGSAKPNVMALGKGDETFFDNPVESLVGATFTSIRNSLRNGTHGEFAKLAQLDKDGLFIRPTKEPAVYGGKVIEHYDNGVVQNYVISDDLADVLHELRNPEQAAGVAEKITGFIGSLKTTSIPYQVRAIPRDWTQAIVNMDGNPLSHIYNMLGMLKSPKKAMKEAMKEGGAFHNAFKDGMGAHRTAQEMAEQFVNANRVKGGKDEIIKSEAKAKKVFKNLWKLNLDYQAGEQLGNFGDSAPRLAAMKQVEKEFMPAITELEGKIANATDDFERGALTDELNALKTKFQREKIFRARDVINYSRRGSSIGAKAFKRYWNFANTATQSVDRYFRQLHKKPVQTLLKTAAISAPMIGAQEMWYRHSSDEDKKIYDDTPDFLKNTMYMFVVGGHRVMLPKPFEVALITSPIEGVVNLSHKYDEEDLKKKALDGVVNGLREIVPLDIGDLVTFNFSAPSIVQPAVEVGFNRKNYNKKPISFYDMFEDGDNKTNPMIPSGKTAKDVASDYTSPTAVELANLSRVNPDYIQHLISGYGGDTGKNGLAALDALLQPSSKERRKVVTQNMNPLQDFFSSKDGSYLWRNTYTEKDKDKKAK